MSRTILTNKGKAALLTVWKDQEIFMGFGSGVATWFTSQTITEDFLPNNTLDTAFDYINTVVVKSEDNATTYVQGTDYTVNLTTGVVTRLSGGGIAAEATVKVSFNVGAPPPSLDMNALIAPIGYKKITGKSFAELDVEGDIIVETGRFSLVLTPQPHLYLSVVLNADEFPGTVIREVGFFHGLTRAVGVGGGVGTLLPNQVSNVGTLSGIKFRAPQNHDGITEHAYKRVISI